MNKAIENYYKELDKLKRFGARNELNLKKAFAKLLNEYAEPKGLMLIEEMAYKNKRIVPDGTIKDALGLDHGYWEAKDDGDDLKEEITKKFAKGYPDDNILFENTDTATLYQNRNIKFENISLQDADALEKLLKAFFSYERPEIADFRKALEKFSEDLPKILEALRQKIDLAFANTTFLAKYKKFLNLCQKSIDPSIDKAHIIEMLLQHILTEDIFKKVFDDDIFHNQNDIAHAIGELIGTFLDLRAKKTLLSSIAHYYDTIKAHAVNISDFGEKRKFLNLIYENFYKAYNPKAADKLGIVYTPNEIVHWMVEATNDLCYKHFGKTLSADGITILDPCIGTGTFLCHILDFLAPNDLKRKFNSELFATELSLLPYYIANLNIEYTYKQRTGEYKEFPNLSFADTLELHKNINERQKSLFEMSEENTERIERQEAANINIVIGNPPYNANQQNENDNNKNRSYPAIDKRIKETYIKLSNAQKTKMYDMYSRFFRWASDRLGESGIVCFITNSSFIHSKTFDGFRASVFSEFQEIYVLDLGGDVRKNPKISGTKNNVFGIQTGVAIAILIKNPKLQSPKLNFLDPFDPMESRLNKLQWLSQNQFRTLNFGVISPDAKHNWLEQTDNDWNSLIAMGSKDAKAGKQSETIFKLFSLGVVTARDEWVYDFDKKNLESKSKYFIDEYSVHIKQWQKTDKKQDIHKFIYNKATIKYTSELENHVKNCKTMNFSKENLIQSSYRPFVKQWTYFSEILTHRRYQQNKIFLTRFSNFAIVLNIKDNFYLLAINCLPDYHLCGDTQTFPLYYYENNERYDNITDWALEYFRVYYGVIASEARQSQDTKIAASPTAPRNDITKLDIFHYCYAILHEPKYREDYAVNLKQDLPRIPLRDDFKKYAKVGKELLDLHINFENAEPYSLMRMDIKNKKQCSLMENNEPKAFCRLNKGSMTIELDEITQLMGVPPEVLDYKLGIRCAVEWVLDQYRPKKPKDPTIAAKFNNYKFSEHKEKVVELLGKVVAVSLGTNELVKELR